MATNCACASQLCSQPSTASPAAKLGTPSPAGVQAPMIYRLFGDKDGLLEAVAEHVMAAYVAAKAEIAEAAPAAGIDPLTDLRAAWQTQIDFGVGNPSLFRLLSDPDRVRQSPAARRHPDTAGHTAGRSRFRPCREHARRRSRADHHRPAGTGLSPMAHEIRSVEDGQRLIWPLLADAFARLRDLPEPPSPDEVVKPFGAELSNLGKTGAAGVSPDQPFQFLRYPCRACRIGSVVMPRYRAGDWSQIIDYGLVKLPFARNEFLVNRTAWLVGSPSGTCLTPGCASGCRGLFSEAGMTIMAAGYGIRGSRR
jgi:AcrR family transcriptional regulator